MIVSFEYTLSDIYLDLFGVLTPTASYNICEILLIANLVCKIVSTLNYITTFIVVTLYSLILVCLQLQQF